MPALRFLAALGAGYLLGSVPVGLIIGRLYRGIDIRRYGSRRTGATNVLRTLGPGAAASVVAGDMAKGALAVLVARQVMLGESAATVPVAEVLGALGALAGHNWSIFIRWSGGRGVLVSTGALLVLCPASISLSALVALPIIGVSRLVSLGSLVGTTMTAALVFAFVASGAKPRPYAVFAAIGATVIFLQHRDNIERLLAGTERRLGQTEAMPPTGAAA